MSRLGAAFALLVPMACVALAQQPPVVADGTTVASTHDAPTLSFLVRPDTADLRVVRRVRVFYVATLEVQGGQAAFYRVEVEGIDGGGLLVAVATALPVDQQLRALRGAADEAALEMIGRMRFSCDTIRPRKPAQTFGYACL